MKYFAGMEKQQSPSTSPEEIGKILKEELFGDQAHKDVISGYIASLEKKVHTLGKIVGRKNERIDDLETDVWNLEQEVDRLANDLPKPRNLQDSMKQDILSKLYALPIDRLRSILEACQEMYVFQDSYTYPIVRNPD